MALMVFPALLACSPGGTGDGHPDEVFAREVGAEAQGAATSDVRVTEPTGEAGGTVSHPQGEEWQGVPGGPPEASGQSVEASRATALVRAAERVAPSVVSAVGRHIIPSSQDLEVVTVTPQIRAEQDLRSEAGALITGISPALSQSLGLRRGDVIFRINNTPIRSADEAARAFRELRAEMRVSLFFERGGAAYFREFTTRG